MRLRSSERLTSRCNNITQNQPVACVHTTARHTGLTIGCIDHLVYLQITRSKPHSFHQLIPKSVVRISAIQSRFPWSGLIGRAVICGLMPDIIPDSQSMAHIPQEWSGIPIISFNSSGNSTLISSTLPDDELKSLIDGIKTTTLSSHESSQCSRCGKAAQLACKACKDLPAVLRNKTMMTWYCSKACQKDDWNVHKPRCKEVKAR